MRKTKVNTAEAQRKAASTQIRRSFLLLSLFALVLPLNGQEEARDVHFSLSSNRTYAPGEKASIAVYAENVDSLEFRVYRVNDPIEFFRKLEDAHNFGGRVPRLPMAYGWLEQFNQWKREWRIAVRDFFRMQYSDESRGRIRDWMLRREQEKPPPQQPATTQLAELPVLNPQQLISKWRQPLPERKYRWDAATIPIELPGKGLFLVEAVHKNLRAYTILNVTELGIISKVAPGQVLVFAQSRITGKPVTMLPVVVMMKRKELARLDTDAQGLAETNVQEEKPEDVIVMGKSGEDFAVSDLSSWTLRSNAEDSITGYLYTDRPVYRPGHIVHYKGILRAQAGAAYIVPAKRTVQVEIRDPEYNNILTTTAALSSNGTFYGEYELPASAPLGYYAIETRLGEAETYGGFHVEEYKKPEYEVGVTPEPRRVIQGQPIRATISARYYFGEPVANAKVTWVVHASRYWTWFYGDEEAQSDEGEAETDRYYSFDSEQQEEHTGTLDADGKLTVTLPTRVNDKKYDVRYRIEARITDQANREISGFGTALATYGSFLLNVQPESYVASAGSKAAFLVEARDYDGKFQATSARVDLRRYTWTQSGKKESPVLASAQVQTTVTGPARVELPVAEAGSYTACATARTPEGRDTEDCGYLWVSGMGGQSIWGRGQQRVEIVPDKKSYKPGEKAKVLIITGVPSAHILVTTEGKILFSKRVIEATDSNITLEIPIEREYAPNFFINVAFLHQNQLYQGSKSVKVPPDEHKLNVEVQSSKKEYKPGEAATVNVVAKDSRGRPVPAAEFSLGVVDEAIYAIRPESARDIVRVFYGNQYNRVNTDSSLSYYFHGEAGKRAMFLARSGVAGGVLGGILARSDMAQIKPEKLVEPKIRKAFPDTAYWVADITTDSGGKATARFNFPDALTQWRATARGITRDTKVGNAIERATVRKNLMLRLAVPRFFTEGDEVVVSALVHNYLADEKKARVSLDVQGLEVIEGATRDVSIPIRGEVKVDWRVRAIPGKEVKVLGKALTNEESDAMELTLPVIPFGVKQSIARAGSTDQTAGDIATEITFPQQISPHSRALEVSVSPSLAGALFGALEYLTTFPYGCTEQTMSSFLPNIVVAKALKELGVKSNVDEAELQMKIAEGLDRLRDFQHEDGGWGWWKTDESHAFMTAYVLAGLVQAEDAGYKVPANLGSARAWLVSEFIRNKKILPDLRAYIGYALLISAPNANLKPDAKSLDELWAQRNDMSAYGRALTGLALDAAGDSRAAQMAELLEREAIVSEDAAYWKVDRDMLMDFYGDASPEATAHAVKLLVKHRPQSPLLPKAAVWLMRSRNEGYYWYSTKQTAMVIYGLTDYLKSSGELKPNFNVTVSVNGRQVLTKKFTAADALAPTPPMVRLEAKDLAPGTNQIRITKSGAGRLYWSATLDYFSTEEKLAGKGSVELNLLREYYKLVSAREGDKIVHRLEPFSGSAAPGDVIAVRLTVTGGVWKYLIVEDPIPAGTEFIERDDLYDIKDKPSWWGWWFTRREFHDDRAAFFETYFLRGQQQYLYLLKVVNPGKFRASPARVQPMYQPRVFATTESRALEVK